MKKWIIGPIFFLLITNVACGAIKKASWTEFKPKAVKGITLSGSMGLGCQVVEDGLGKQKQGVNANMVINFARPISEKIGIDGNIQLKKQAFTSGSEDKLEGSLGFKSRLFEVNFSSDLSNLSDIVERVENQSRQGAIKAGIKLSISENFPLTVNYSKSYNNKLKEALTTEDVSREEYGLGLESKFGRVQTNLNLNYNQTLNPIQNSKSRARKLGVNSIIMLSDIFQLSLEIQPGKTETMPIDESKKVTSKQANYTAALTSKFSERLRLMAKLGLINSFSKSDTTETSEETFNQNYDLFYQPTAVLSLNTVLNLAKTKDANNQGITANINYSPEGSRFLGQTGMGFQVNRTLDDTGMTRSENTTSSLNSLLRFSEAMNLGSNFTHSTQKTNPLTGKASLTISDNLNLKFSHQVFKDLSYSLGYVLNAKTKDSSKDITNSYQGDIAYNFRLKLKEREIPISASQLFNYSRSNGKKSNTQGTKVSVQIPITSLLSTSYACSINSGQTDSSSNKTTQHTIDLSLKGKTRPFTLATNFSFIDSTGADALNINASLTYSIWERLSLNLNFIQNRKSNEPTTPTNITAGLNYNF